MNNYVRRLLICLSIIENNSIVLKNIWEDEIKNNDGYLKEEYLNNLDTMYSISKRIQDKYNLMYPKKEIDATVKNIYAFASIGKSKKNKEGEIVYGYSFKKERDLLPKGMLDSTITISYVANYIVGRLELTVNREKLDKDIKELFDNAKSYINFTEEELILNKYIVRDKDGKSKR